MWPLTVINKIEAQNELENLASRRWTMSQRPRKKAKRSSNFHDEDAIEELPEASELIHIKPMHLFHIEEGWVKSISNI